MPALVPRSLAFLSTLVLLGPAAGAEGPPVDTRQFPRLVRLLLLPEEASLAKQLKNDEDQREFQAIFWARRDPTPRTAANEWEAGVRDTWTRADKLFAYPNQKGSETGCGQVLALLGQPEEVLGLETRVRFDDLQYVREGNRRAETWIYRDRPSRPFTFTKAELRVAFDSDCGFAEGGFLAEDLKRAAAALVTRPDLAYTRGPDSRLVKLAAQTGGAAGAIDLLATPRSDFPLAAETKLVLRAPKGEALVAGLVRFARPATSARVSLAVRATSAGGEALATAVRESDVAAGPDGAGVASWSLPLKPGPWRVAVAVYLGEGGKGSVSSIDVEVPDFGGATLVASPIVAYADEPPSAAPAGLHDPYAAMQLGPRRIRPRFGNLFSPADALMLVATLHGGKLDPATQRASLRSRYSILRDGTPVARGTEDAFETPDAVAAVGPIPLAGYAPGAYLVRLDVNDSVAKQALRQEAAIEIRAAEVKP